MLDLAEKGSIAVLVASSIFQLGMGLANQAHWYPFSFSFRSDPLRRRLDRDRLAGRAHRGQAADHPRVPDAAEPEDPAGPARAAVEPEDVERDTEPSRPSYGGPSRRTILRTALLASGVAVLAAAGNTVPWLRKVSVFAVRDGEGPQGVPINRSAVAAGVTETARAAGLPGHARPRRP